MVATLVMVEPSALLWLYNLLTIVSAGWETIAQSTPAINPEQKVIESWVSLEYVCLGLVKT